MDVTRTELSKLCKVLVSDTTLSSSSAASPSLSSAPSTSSLSSQLHPQSGNAHSTALHRLLAMRYSSCCRATILEKFLTSASSFSPVADFHAPTQDQHRHRTTCSTCSATTKSPTSTTTTTTTTARPPPSQLTHYQGRQPSSTSTQASVTSIIQHQHVPTGATALHVAAFRNPSNLYDIVTLLLNYERHQQQQQQRPPPRRCEERQLKGHYQDASLASPSSSPSFASSSSSPSCCCGSLSTNAATNRPSTASVSSIPMTHCRSYPLHVVCGQNLTIDERVVGLLLRADPTVATRQDMHGDTPLSLLWKNTCRFRWTLSVMDMTKPYIDYIEEDQSSWMTIISPFQFIRLSKLLITASSASTPFSQSSKISRGKNNGDGDDMNDVDGDNRSSDPLSTLSSSATMAPTSTELDLSMTTNNISSDGASSGCDGDNHYVNIHDLCSICRLPPMIYQMSKTKQYNDVLNVVGNARTFDDQGRLPLHVAVQVQPATYRFVPDFVPESARKTLIRHLLDEYPGAVYVRDDTGRLPIHYALHSGFCVEDDLLSLLQLYPHSLRIQDPVTHLFPFMLVAAKHRHDHSISNVQQLNPTSTWTPTASSGGHEVTSKILAKRSILEEGETDVTTSTSSSLLDLTSQRSATGTAGTTSPKSDSIIEDHHWKDDHIRMTFHLLQLCPDVVHVSPKSFPRLALGE